MRYYILAALTLFIVGCSETSTGPDSKPFRMVIYYAPPGCGRVLLEGGTANPYVGIEAGQTVTIGFDKGYTTYPGGSLPQTVKWQKAGDASVKGTFSHQSFAESEVWYDTVRCSP